MDNARGGLIIENSLGKQQGRYVNCELSQNLYRTNRKRKRSLSPAAQSHHPEMYPPHCSVMPQGIFSAEIGGLLAH